MQIRIIAVGRIRDRYLAEGVAEYVKRLKPYTRFTITEVGEDSRPASLSPAQRQQILSRESEKIIHAIPEGGATIALAVDGKLFSSEGLADLLRRHTVRGTGTVSFIIGGDLGLAPSLLERCDLRLSLSPMTFSHPMVRLILLEQIYRAFRILQGEPYHK